MHIVSGKSVRIAASTADATALTVTVDRRQSMQLGSKRLTAAVVEAPLAAADTAAAFALAAFASTVVAVVERSFVDRTADM